MNGNGSGIWIRWALGSLVIICVAITGWFTGRYDRLDEAFKSHTGLVGHAVMVERVEALQDDFVELKEENAAAHDKIVQHLDAMIIAVKANGHSQ